MIVRKPSHFGSKRQPSPDGRSFAERASCGWMGGLSGKGTAPSQVTVLTMATVAEEEYLERIYWLWEAELPITAANIARAMQVSPPTVHEMVGRLTKDGFITRRSDKSLEFTHEGRDRAARIVRRHRLVERFLTDVLGVPWDEVHEEA